MPVDRSNFPLEVQEAFMLHDLLSDRWEGMSGSYFGKEMSALKTYIDVFNITNPKQSLWFLKHIEHYNSQLINEKQKKRRKAQEQKAKLRAKHKK